MNQRNREQLATAKRYGNVVGRFHDGYKQQLVTQAAYEAIAQRAGVVICDRHGERTPLVDHDGTPVCLRCLEEHDGTH